MVYGAIGIKELGPDDAHAGYAHPTGQVFKPAGGAGGDVVVEMEDEGGAGAGGAEVDEPRVVEAAG